MEVEFEVSKLRDRVVSLEAQVAFLYKHLGVTFVPEVGADDDPRIIEQLKKGNKLGAIKIYRELHDTGPEQARTAVEEMKGRLGL